MHAPPRTPAERLFCISVTHKSSFGEKVPGLEKICRRALRPLQLAESPLLSSSSSRSHPLLTFFAMDPLSE